MYWHWVCECFYCLYLCKCIHESPVIAKYIHYFNTMMFLLFFFLYIYIISTKTKCHDLVFSNKTNKKKQRKETQSTSSIWFVFKQKKWHSSFHQIPTYYFIVCVIFVCLELSRLTALSIKIEFYQKYHGHCDWLIKFRILVLHVNNRQPGEIGNWSLHVPFCRMACGKHRPSLCQP